MGGSKSDQVPVKKEEVKVEQPISEPIAPKKPRTFIQESDIFDFAGMTKVGNNAPLVIDKAQKPQEDHKSQEIKPKTTNTKAAAKPIGEQDLGLGEFFKGNKNQGGNVNLNAKKLDINFDNDDFFNSFEPDQPKPKPKPVVQQTKQSETNSNIFSQVGTSFGQKIENNNTQQQSQAAIEQKKMSGDDDVQARYDQLVKSGATAISSDMLFGSESNNQQQQEEKAGIKSQLSALGGQLQDRLSMSSIGSVNSYEDLKVVASQKAASAKETAGRLSDAAQVKASEAKEAVMDWFSSITANNGGS